MINKLSKIIEYYYKLNIPELNKDHWFLADEIKNAVYSKYVIEIDMVAASLTIMNLDPKLKTKYHELLTYLNSIEDKHKRVVLTGQNVSSEDLSYINQLIRISVLTYIYTCFPNSSILEFKRDGAIISTTDQFKHTSHPLCPEIKFRGQSLKFYYRNLSTSFLFLDSDLDIKGRIQLPPALKECLINRVCKDDINVDEIIKVVYSLPFFKYCLQDEELLNNWYRIGQNFLSFTGLGKECHPFSYTCLIYNPIVYAYDNADK